MCPFGRVTVLVPSSMPEDQTRRPEDALRGTLSGSPGNQAQPQFVFDSPPQGLSFPTTRFPPARWKDVLWWESPLSLCE